MPFVVYPLLESTVHFARIRLVMVVARVGVSICPIIKVITFRGFCGVANF